MHRATLFETQTHARDVRRATVVDDGEGALGVTDEERIAADQHNKVVLVDADPARSAAVNAAPVIAFSATARA